MPDEHAEHAGHDHDQEHDLTLQPVSETPRDLPVRPQAVPSPIPDAVQAGESAAEPEPVVALGPETEPPATENERLYALLAHLSGLSWSIGIPGLIGPLVIYLLKKDQSKFVAFHALQAFLLQVAVAVVAAVVSVPVTILSWMSFGLLLKPLIAVLSLAALALLAIVIVTGMNAHKGQWAEYWIFGKIARLKIFETEAA